MYYIKDGLKLMLRNDNSTEHCMGLLACGNFEAQYAVDALNGVFGIEPPFCFVDENVVYKKIGVSMKIWNRVDRFLHCDTVEDARRIVAILDLQRGAEAARRRAA